MPRSALFALGLLLILYVGCARGPELHEVTGTVRYEDGSVPQAEFATITFEPVDPQGKAAFSNIEPDGSYRLSTFTQGDGGALAGDYRVTVNVMNGYPQRVLAVAKEFTDFNQTPLEAQVTPNEPNHFEFTVKRP